MWVASQARPTCARESGPPQLRARMSTRRRPRSAASATTWSKAFRAAWLYTPEEWGRQGAAEGAEEARRNVWRRAGRSSRARWHALAQDVATR